MDFKTFVTEGLNRFELNEVKFNEKNIEKVVQLYSKIMGRKMGGAFKPMGFETYKRKMGPGKGFRVMNDAGEMLRFNWDERLAKKAQYELTSIDYWASGNVNFQQPTRTVKFAPELNVIQVLEKVIDALLTGSINEAKEIIKEVNLLLETKLRTPQEKQEWLIANGLPKSLAGSEKSMRARAAKVGLSEQLEVFLGQVETNSLETKLKETEKVFNKEVYADPETVFDDIEDLLSVVAAGKWRTLIVCGMGGIGKTYHITEGPRSLEKLLGPEGDKWTYHSGTKAAPFAFYKTLFQERDKVIVFDEADSILKNQDIVMMLKPILDTSGDNMAEYMSGTRNMVGMSMDDIEDYSKEVDMEIADGGRIGTGKKDVNLPSKFKFSGGMIFISNMRAKEIEGAIMSRSIFIDVYLAQSDVLKRIQTIATHKYGADRAVLLMDGLGQSSAAPAEEITYMTPEYARKVKPFSVRTMELANILESSGLSRWSTLAQMYA
jgi:hypothetical protein